MSRRSILCGFVVLAAIAAVGPASAATPKPKAPAAPVCAKLLTAATLNSLTGGNFTVAKTPAPVPFACAWNGTATGLTNITPTDAYHQDLTLFMAVGKAAIASGWKTYSHPNPMYGAPIFLSGIGDRAVEANDYIAVVKGNTFFQMWAGNNGVHHLEYPQLEAVAKYLVSKLK
jgi:hypothetical protein